MLFYINFVYNGPKVWGQQVFSYILERCEMLTKENCNNANIFTVYNPNHFDIF